MGGYQIQNILRRALPAVAFSEGWRRALPTVASAKVGVVCLFYHKGTQSTHKGTQRTLQV